MRQGLPAYRQFSYNKVFSKNGKVSADHRQGQKLEPLQKNQTTLSQTKKHVIIVKESAPPQNQTARF